MHHMLIELGEEEKAEWLQQDDTSDTDDAERAPCDALNQGIPNGSAKELRRTRIMHYFEEHYYF